MSEIPPTRRTDDPPSQDGVTLAGWPVTITVEEATALQAALKQLQTALDAVVRERDDLLAEVERQARHIEELQQKLDAEKSCACSYDAPGDVCAAHSPTLAEERAKVERLRVALEPFAKLSLWPDDVGDYWASHIRSDDDWDEEENDNAREDDIFIKRGDIRAARKALGCKEGGR